VPRAFNQDSDTAFLQAVSDVTRNVRFWHKADMGITAANACYRGKADIDQPLLIVISIL